MRKIYLIAGILFIQLSLSAQSKFRFRSINQLGLVLGASGPAYQFQTINGVSFKSFSAGVGIGTDDYYLKTVPLFVDVRKSFGHKKMQPFTYLDAGANFPLKKADTDHTSINNGTYTKGFYFDAGAGYSFKIKKIGGILFSLGYSEKTIDEHADYYSVIYPLPEPYTPSANQTYYKYTLSRVTMKFGLSF